MTETNKSLPLALLEYIDAAEEVVSVMDRYGRASPVTAMMMSQVRERWDVLRTLVKRRRSDVGIPILWIVEEDSA